ncbi:xylulokinase [Shimia gijangensis]|uniref:Xylulokinase n=1 Tax=Shimia gijangensis TaxID=1470563 RepID=A0A1M6JT99_9RHOB|nr:FGGY family carbohydrate kinase [Shimia gijangensis]SHJ49938.1 xylulokinase [Shimia gijangensis]
MQHGDLVITADFGTSAVKVGVVDGDLTLLSKATEAYPLNLAPGGIAEQNPADLWAALARALSHLRHDIPNLKERATTLVFSSQICGLICADVNGRPLMPCMTWLDKRAAQTGRDLIGGFPSAHGYQIGKLLRWLRIANGAPAKNGMDPIAKILWVAKHKPDISAQTRWFLDVKDWLVHRATGRFTSSAESANVTWLLDSRPGREGWSKTLSKMTGIPFEKLPEIVDATDVVETLTAEAAGELGLSKDAIVLGGTSDVTAAALGSGEVDDGALHICASTSCWISGFMSGRRLNVPNSYATISSSLSFRPLLVASQENAGSAMEWAVRISGGQTEGENLANAFDDMGTPLPDDPYFVPWLAGERVPIDNDLVRGAFHGLALHHDPRAMRRATVEGVALNMLWSYSKVTREKGIRMDGPLSMVGGVAANPDFAQTVADAFDREIRVGEARHAGVLGTATLAAKVQGWAADPFEAAARLRTHTTAHYVPNPDRVEALAMRNTRLEKIRRDLIRSYRP